MKIQETYEWLKIYEQGLINSADIARELNINKRQFYRILQRYKTKGIIGLQHQNKNHPSHHRMMRVKRAEIIMRLIVEKYYDCGASYASELLQEYEDITVNRETLRLWMKQEQLLIKQRKRKPYRKRRERKTTFGEMLQIDGCFDYWFGRDKPKACLINLIDDATSYYKIV